jgi:hypothetical protein
MISLSAYGQLSLSLDRTKLVAGQRAAERQLRHSEASFTRHALTSLVDAVSGFFEPLTASCVGLAVPNSDLSQDWPHGGKGRDSLGGQSRHDESERRAGSSEGRPKSAAGWHCGNDSDRLPGLWKRQGHSAMGWDSAGSCAAHRRAACTRFTHAG